MSSALDDLLAALDPSATPELRSRITAALASPESELARAVKGVERWARQHNPHAPSPDVEASPLPAPGPATLRISLEQRAAALLDKGAVRRGQAELARLLLDEMSAGFSEADDGRMLQALNDPESELSQLVRGFKQWVTASQKRP